MSDLTNNKKETENVQNNFDFGELFPASETEKEVQHKRGFMPSPFIAASLPLRDVKKNYFERKYNNITLSITGAPKVPYGKYGRLLLTILTTHAVLSKSQPGSDVVINYKSMSQLLEEMQLPSSRVNDIRQQLDCFSKASFIFEEKVMKITQKSLFRDLLDENDNQIMGDTVTATKVSTGSIPFVEGLQYVELDDKAGNKRQVGITIRLSPSFTRFSQDHSVPIDYTVYKEISSAVGKDLYAWLIYRNNSLTSNEPLFITREAFVSQFMPVDEHSNRNQERVNFDYLKEQIKIIQKKYYPELKVSFDENNLGLTLYKSKSPMLGNDTHYVLVTTGDNI